ncbi:MAG TPA: nickel pincer cofactor biosynthesis protein LarC [Solibacterales bacterium]|nr:nickel pincer cofactor biosynthesis protein LarC [Bryobacterales bacterium]
MKICYFDAFAGIAGDMTIGALLDAGADREGLFAALASLNLGATFTAEKTRRRGIAATKFDVHGGETKAHRHLPHIVKIIAAGALPEAVKEAAGRIFQQLGEAEAAVHGVPIEKVHFHEVGAVDSICDIVGAAWCLHSLGVGEVRCSAVNVGSGTVNTEHGVLPVPAPATALLLRDRPVYARGPAFELTTPTGAAILAALSTCFGPPPPMTVQAIGYGAGTKDFTEHANVVRAMIGQSTAAAEATTITVIEANIDDSTPEILGWAMERLLEAGALDVTLQPVLMKKNRAATLLRVLAKPEDQESLAAVMLRETTTLGLRLYAAERRVLARRTEEVDTRWGKVRVKVSEHGAAPEYEDCRRLAVESGAPLKEILAEAALLYRKNTQ